MKFLSFLFYFISICCCCFFLSYFIGVNVCDSFETFLYHLFHFVKCWCDSADIFNTVSIQHITYLPNRTVCMDVSFQSKILYRTLVSRYMYIRIRFPFKRKGLYEKKMGKYNIQFGGCLWRWAYVSLILMTRVK